ncbi:MAG: hypothetical protein AAF438_21295 [Pseudomonadota bacterium]
MNVNWNGIIIGVMALAVPMACHGDPPGDSKNARVVSDASSSPITIDVRNLGWDVYQPFWNPELPDLTVESFDFDDKSALERITKLRSLSLVTFAETTNTRLFFGVNKEGLVGLHFSAFPRYGKDRHMSLWSMPYVTKTQALESEDVERVKLDLLKETLVEEEKK